MPVDYKNNKKASLVILFVSALVLFFDRLSKWWILRNPCFFEDGWFEISLFKNENFFLLSFSAEVINAIAITALLVLLAFLLWSFLKDNQYLLAGLSLIFFGGLSNFLDRLVYGFAVDWIHVDHIMTSVFNLADFFIFLGVVVVIFSIFNR